MILNTIVSITSFVSANLNRLCLKYDHSCGWFFACIIFFKVTKVCNHWNFISRQLYRIIVYAKVLAVISKRLFLCYPGLLSWIHQTWLHDQYFVIQLQKDLDKRWRTSPLFCYGYIHKINVCMRNTTCVQCFYEPGVIDLTLPDKKLKLQCWRIQRPICMNFYTSFLR